MMNINQQAEIEDLFRRINKTISKNQKHKVGDEDLNKVRAYVVQSKSYHYISTLFSRSAAFASGALALEGARGEGNGREV